MRAVFIRAPWLAEYGDAVEILAEVDGHPVAARQDNMLVISFHPEIAGETRVHELFLRDVARDRLLHAPRRVGANVADRTMQAEPEDADRLSERGWEQARGLGRAAAGRGDRGDPRQSRTAARRRPRRRSARCWASPFETDEDLHEVRQSDAYRAASPDYEGTGHVIVDAGVAARSRRARRGVVRRDPRRASRACRSGWRRGVESERILCVSHWGFMHFFLGAALFREDFSPAHLPALYRMSHINTGITLFQQRRDYLIEGDRFDGWALHTWNDQAHLQRRCAAARAGTDPKKDGAAIGW